MMGPRTILALSLLAQVGSVSAGQQPLLTWWVTGSLVKIKPGDAAPRPASKMAYISAARNEFEPFQIVLRPEGRDVADVDLDCSDLRNSSGAVIPHDNVTLYAEQYVNLSQPSSLDGGAGLWPDPLVPRVDRYANERRNAFPMHLAADRNQPVWVEVYVPESAAPGDYTGSVRVTRKGAPEFSIPVRLRVWAFTLPSTASLPTSFGLNGVTALKQHRGEYTSDSDLYALTRLYSQAALLHRLSIHGGSMAPPKYHGDARHIDIDWHPYDAEVAPFLEGTAIPPGAPLHGARATSIDLRAPAAFPNAAEQAAYFAAYYQHFRQNHWDDRLFYYLWDEPKPADLPKVFERGQAAERAVPELRTLLTLPYNARLRDVVKIWVPLVNCLEPRPGFPDYCAEQPPLDSYDSEIQQGKSFWFYQSCASHGCNGPGAPYFEGWPSYMIDASPLANRIMPWVAWRFHIQGELYYSMDELYAYNQDPWTNVRIDGGNGEGTLFYPGRVSRIGGHTDIPIETIRLKLIREGMEDYEYLVLLAKLCNEKTASDYASRIVTAPYQWNSDAESFSAVRREMGEKLDHLVRSRTARASDAQ